MNAEIIVFLTILKNIIFSPFRQHPSKPIGFENSIFTIIMVFLALFVIFGIAYFIFRILKNIKQPNYDGSFKRLLRPQTESTNILPSTGTFNVRHCVKMDSIVLSKLDILFSSNHNIHKSSHGLSFWISHPLIKRFY